MPLREDDDGTLVLAGDDPSADLSVVPRPARLVLAPAPLVGRLLADQPGAAPAGPAAEVATPTAEVTAPPAQAAAITPEADADEAEPDEHARWDAVMRWPTADERAPRRPPPRGALVSFLAVVAVAAVVALGASLFFGAEEGGEAGPAVVEDSLPAGLRAALGVPSLPRGAAVGHACDGGLAIIATPRPRDAACDLIIGAEATRSATVLLAPGGGCISADRAERLVRERRGRPAPSPRPDGLEPVAVRPRDGGACVTPDLTSLRAGFYPLLEMAILVLRGDVAGSAASQKVADALRATETSAPVTTIVLDSRLS